MLNKSTTQCDVTPITTATQLLHHACSYSMNRATAYNGYEYIEILVKNPTCFKHFLVKNPTWF